MAKKPKKPQRGELHIRWMIQRDMPEVLEIERENYEYPWPGEDFHLLLRQANCIGMVATINGKVVGFMIYELYKTKIDVVNFAIADDSCCLGYGRKMLLVLKSKLGPSRRTRLNWRVAETNLPVQLFLRKNGFNLFRVDSTDEQGDIYCFAYERGVGNRILSEYAAYGTTAEPRVHDRALTSDEIKLLGDQLKGKRDGV